MDGTRVVGAAANSEGIYRVELPVGATYTFEVIDPSLATACFQGEVTVEVGEEQLLNIPCNRWDGASTVDYRMTASTCEGVFPDPLTLQADVTTSA